MSITSYGPITSVQGLANVIQGEALGGSSADAFGVASTIQNRLNNGGWGSTIAQVVTPSQFNGYATAAPGSPAYTYAQAIFDGNLSSYGNTGNATYYTASNFSTNPSAPNYVNPSMQGVASSGNVLTPGGNSYATGSATGPSTNGVILPSLGGSNGGDDFIDPNFNYGGGNVAQGDTITASSFDSGSALAPGLSGSGTVGFNATTPGASGLGGGSTLFGGDTSGDSVTYANPGSDDIGDFYPDAASGAGSTAGGAVGAVAGAGGAPVDITDLPGLDQSVSGAGKAVQTGAGTIGTDVQQAAGGIAGTAASIFNNAQTYFSGAVAVIALVILGLIFVAFGLSMFKHNLAAAV